MAIASLTSIIFANGSILGLGLGIGLAYALMLYYFYRTSNNEGGATRAYHYLKDILLTGIVLGAIIVVDQGFSMFMSSLTGVTLKPGDHVRLAEGLTERMLGEVKSTLYWSYLGEAIISFFGSMTFTQIFDITPGSIGKLGKVGRSLAHITKVFTDKIGGAIPKKLSNGLTGALDIGSVTWSIAPMAGISVLYGSSNFLDMGFLEKTTTILFFMVIAYYILYTITTLIIPLSAIFLPLGLALMFIPVTRKTGASIVSLVAAMYFVYPFTLLYMDNVFRGVQWYDTGRLVDFLSPTLAGIFNSDPAYSPGDIQYSSFLMRELSYKYKKDPTKKLIPMNVSDADALVNYLEYRQICLPDEPCENILGQTIDEETARKGVYNTFKSSNVIAPWGSFLKKTGMFLGEVWILSQVGNVIELSVFDATGIGYAIRLLLKFIRHLATTLILLGSILPIPPDSPLASILPPYLPFLFFKNMLQFIMIVGQYSLFMAVMVFFQVFLIISAYRAIAMILGGELSLPGFEKVI